MNQLARTTFQSRPLFFSANSARRAREIAQGFQMQVALLDILPRNATKLHAIKYLQQHLGYGLQEIIFAGDSGNDLPVLGSSIRSILVANADSDIKRQAQQLAEKNGCAESLYIARQGNTPHGGNYTAGVLQGVEFFIPEIRAVPR